MEEEIIQLFNNLDEPNREIQNESYDKIMRIMNTPVDWTYLVWGKLINSLTHKDGHVRVRSVQFLCALVAKSDPEERVLEDFLKIWAVTYDEKIVTARYSLQSIWRISLAGQVQKDLIVARLAKRFQTCIEEKNTTLIRYDIIVSLKKIAEATEDQYVLEIARKLIDKEIDQKHKEKYLDAIK
ncbi:MAG: hypothetical protein RR595_04545 [Lysinibacillus sp.]